MISISDIPKIREAYSKLKPEEVLNKLNFESTTLFNTKNIHIHRGWVYYQEGSSLYHGAVNLDNPNKNSDKFIEGLSQDKSIQRIYSNEVQQSELLSKYPSKSAMGYIYIFSNTKNIVNREGSKFQRYRASYKYLDDENIRIEEFSNKNPLTLEALDSIKNLNKSWVEHHTAHGNKPAYKVDRCIENIYEYGKLCEYYVSLIWYGDTLLHYHTSERLHSNFVVMLDSKTNFSIPHELERKFQYVSFLDHYLNVMHWHQEGIGEIYYHTGMSEKESYKNRLRPTHKVKHTVYLTEDMPFIKYKEVEASELF